ncbi:pyruvate kinase [Hydrobacter penzbergensis]|jgi:pyruvate kinase|uniref:Pyruvate kinase n=1 Tax=Hydrobacter penzbergensis TaxID=1235997 RepID=A0A8X8IHJ6_9BACT|nr:pyruvate kinase [Hydrobacter penzbergensis]MBN8718976.1 pyruvate kinase [Sediminibacterium magnilacihabitans]PQV61340.1 pyruvate kinase [Sediminibacterium magnilacihabitans]SDX39972.1 pyruvate kinase [Hydrobacter penzbergensis]|eukprot:jgi/Mesen1/3384/ME001918S02328
MSKNIDKYLHKDMNKEAGIDHVNHRTKIVATVGPACDTYEKLLELVQAGVNVFRLNFSHGSHEDKARIIEHIRNINKTQPYNISILADLQGPKLRVGEILNNALEVKVGDILTFTNEKCIGTLEKIYVSYPNLAGDVTIGNIILIDDGKLEVKVVSIEKNGDVKVVVTLGGILSSKKGINLPDTKISLPALTEKDLADLEFIIEQKCDWVALSFVRSVNDIVDLKRRLREKQSKSKIIAKIEKPEALTNIRDIIVESDGIMVARGDLGVELPVERIPLIQKELIRKCLHRAKPVIVATQMMESMIDRVKPNRSEITDVANAVLEGADAVMLSGETATGQHPALVVQTMRKIIMEVESKEYRYNRSEDLKPQPHSPSFHSDAVCYNACKISEDVQAKALIGMTQSGYTAFMLSSYRPSSPLYIFTKEKTLVNQLSLSWGVRAFYYAEEDSLDDIIFDQINILKERGFVNTNDVVVNTGSTPVHLHLPTNIIKITKAE